MDDKKINRVLIIAVIVLLLLTVFNCNKSRNLRVDNNILEQNKKALSDSIRVTKNKFLYIGRLSEVKNLAFLIKVFNCLLYTSDAADE